MVPTITLAPHMFKLSQKKDLGIVKMVELLHLVCHFVMEK
jgi:hypothetical protein